MKLCLLQFVFCFKEDPTTPFSEADYKKRRAHPNYKEHINCEREVVLQGRKVSKIY